MTVNWSSLLTVRHKMSLAEVGEFDSLVSEQQGFLFGEGKTFFLEHRGFKKGDPLPFTYLLW